MTLKQTVRKLVPEPLISAYHWFLAKLAAVVFGFPSSKLIVIGITGTSGKSTTVQFLGQMLEAAGKRVGWASTVSFKVAEREWVNEKKMTMLGRFQTQKLFREMVVAGCEYAIVEVSSQGVVQHRHVGINFDVATLTNLWPEHIEAHGGFENYKKAKGKFFEFVAKSPVKKLGGKVIHKSFVVNVDNQYAPWFFGLIGGDVGAQKLAPAQFGFGVDAEEVKLSADGSEFQWESLPVFIEPIGLHNVYNAVCAASIMKALGFSFSETVTVMEKIKSVSGRMEAIEVGQDFSVIVDYAFEPKAVLALYETVRLLPHQKIIHVLGSTGGGRDIVRRPALGKIAGEKADFVIVTNEDPYDDDPQEIIDQVAAGALGTGPSTVLGTRKQEGENLFRILDRRAAIEKAVSLAKTGDLILITGKGSEPVMAVAGGKTIPWDDRQVVREVLKSL